MTRAQNTPAPLELLAALRLLAGHVHWIDDPSELDSARFRGGARHRGTGYDRWTLDDGTEIHASTPVAPVPDGARITLPDRRTVDARGTGAEFVPSAPFVRRALPWDALGRALDEHGLPSAGVVELRIGDRLVARVEAVSRGWVIAVEGERRVASP